MRVQQQVGAALRGVADRVEGGAEVGRAFRLVLAVHVDPAQALGHRPAVERAPGMHQRLPEQLDHPRFVGGFDHQQRGLRAQQRDQVLQFAHGIAR